MFVPKTTDELAMTHHCKTIIPSFGIVRKQSGEAHMTPLINLNHMPTGKKDNCVVTAVRQCCTCIKQVAKHYKKRRQWRKRLICQASDVSIEVVCLIFCRFIMLRAIRLGDPGWWS